MSPESYLSNHLLAALDASDMALLRPHLRPFELVHEAVLLKAGDLVNHVYFPRSGVVSLVVRLMGGEAIEVAMVGRDSVVGGASALDGATALNEAIVQIAGVAFVIELAPFRAAVAESPTMRMVLARHQELLLAQAQQTAACNATHKVEARLARWLLRACDLVGSNTLLLTQEFLAQMIGARRTSVSLAAHGLQQAGLIHYHRGRVDIVNVEALKISACECYATVKAHADRLLD